MKLSDRIKRKMMGVNLSSVAFFAVSMIAITLAWFAYTNTISSNFNVNLKSWNIEVRNGEGEISNTYTFNIDDAYPGMTEFDDGLEIHNQGDIPAKINYNITYFRVFNDEVSLSRDVTFADLEKDYPFRFHFTWDSLYLDVDMVDVLNLNFWWNLDSGNDELDTQYGNMAYEFKQQEEQRHNQDSSYIIRPSIELKVEVVVSQFVDNANSFSTDSWDTIQTAIYSGSAYTKYHLGDTKTVSINNSNYTVRIVNNSGRGYCGNPIMRNKTACGWVFEFTDVITSMQMNTTATNVGGFPNTNVYNYLQNDLYNQLPSDLRKVIIITDVDYGYGANDNTSTHTSDPLFLLSGVEIFGSDSNDTLPVAYTSSSYGTTQLDYYSSNNVTESNYGNYTKKKLNGVYTAWWLRSATNNSSVLFRGVSNSGSLMSSSANTSNGIAPAFRIA